MNAVNDKLSVPSSTERIKTWREGSVLHVRFNNPEKHNALSMDMWEAVPLILAQASNDDSVRMVVFSGEGGRAFVSGADISQFEDQRAAKEAVKRYEQMAEAALQGIYEFSKPTVACIRGYCIGDKVIRHSMVKVAVPTNRGETETDPETGLTEAPDAVGRDVVRDVDPAEAETGEDN